MRSIAASAAYWVGRGRIGLLAVGALMLVAPATASATIVAGSQPGGNTLVAQNTGATPESGCDQKFQTNGIFDTCEEPSFDGASWTAPVTAYGGKGNPAYYQMPGSDWVGQYSSGWTNWGYESDRVLDNHWTQYKTTFDLPANTSLGVRVLVDNAVTGIYINGNQLSTCTRQSICDGFTQLPYAVEIPDKYLQPTGNELKITVLNYENSLATGGLDYQVVTRGPDVANLPAPNVTGAAGGTLTASGSFQESFQADQAVPVTLTANNTVGTFKDNGNGTWTWSDPNATGPASGTITVTATDANGRSSTESFNYSVAAPPDSTPPVIAPTVTGTQGAGGWYTSDVGVSWSVTDPQSAISSQSGCGNQSVTTDTAGVTFTCKATSAGGTASKSVTIKRDATAPSLSVSHSADGAGGWNKSSPVTETVSASDSGSGLSGNPSCTVDNNPATITPGASAGTWTFTVSGDGTHAVSCLASDNAGNQANAADQVNLDTAAPSTTDDAPAGWENKDVTVHLSPSDPSPGSGVANTYYSVDGGAQQSGTSVSIPTSLGDGSHSISYYSVDAAGNQETAHAATVNIDTKAPATTDDAPSGWQNKDVTVHLSPSDPSPGSGVASTHYSVDGGSDQTGTSVAIPTSLGDGSHTVSYYSVDNAGNQEATHTATVNIDTTPPKVSVSNSPDGQNGWNVSSPITETVTASDATSGVAGAPSCTLDGNPVTLSAGSSAGAWTFQVSGDGRHAVSCSALDNAGNSASGTDTAKIDTQAPSTSASGVPAGWVNHDLTVNLSASDPSPGSGVAGTHYTVDGGSTQDGTSVTLSDEGTHHVSYWSVDNAGNAEAKNSATVKIDKTPPAVSVSHSVDGKNGWNVSSPVTETVKASDGGSGLAGAPTCSIDGQDASLTATGDGTWTVPVSGDGTHSVSCSASDNAGNKGSGADTTNIDTTPPKVTYTGNAGTYTVADSVSISCSASDPTPGSGLAGSTCQNISGDAYTFSLGTNSYSATGTDNAGNVGKGQTSFKVTVDSGSLCTLTKRWVTNPGIAGALCAKLDAAGASIARGDTNSKNGQLDAYRNQLSAQSGKSVAADKAAILTKLSQAL